jgi:hypothetical protein
MPQDPDIALQQEIFQLKLRDGPLGEGKLRFYAKHTTFHEV